MGNGNSKISILKRHGLAFLSVLSVLWLPPCLAQEQMPGAMTVSYVNHPYIIEKLLPVIDGAYASLGIDAEFVLHPSKRNLQVLADGVTDAEAAFSELLIKPYPNLIAIGPSLTQSVFVLVCHKSVPCEQSVLFDNTQQVVMTDSSRDGLKLTFGARLQAEIYSINSLDRIPQLLDDRRLSYGVYVVSKLEGALKSHPHLRMVELYRTHTYHILNDKFAFLADRLGSAISEQLAKRDGR